jgi:hypothetical protein
LESNSQEKKQPVEEVERPTPAVVEGAAPVALPRGQGSACTGAGRPSADFWPLAKMSWMSPWRSCLQQQLQLKEAIDQFQQKCLMLFSKNRSSVPYLKSDMPRVLLPGEPDTTSAEEKQEVFGMVRKAFEDIMARHNTAFLNSFR